MVEGEVSESVLWITERMVVTIFICMACKENTVFLQALFLFVQIIFVRHILISPQAMDFCVWYVTTYLVYTVGRALAKSGKVLILIIYWIGVIDFQGFK